MVGFDIADVDCAVAAFELAEAGRTLSRRGWVSTTSGDFSARISKDPLRMAALSDSDSLVVDRTEGLIAGDCCASAEMAIHLEQRVRAVLHTSSIHTTMLADRHARTGGVAVTRCEMSQALSGGTGQEHYDWIPAHENSQD